MKFTKIYQNAMTSFLYEYPMRYLAWILLLTFACANVNADSSPNLSAIGSLLVPGSAQLIQERTLDGTTHFLSFGAGIIGSSYYSQKADFISDDELYNDDESIMYLNQTTLYGSMFSSLTFNTMLYSSFDAYRGSRLLKGNTGYRTDISRESASELALAPFSTNYLSRPTTYLPLILITLMSYDDPFAIQWNSSTSQSELLLGMGVIEDMTAVGEEAFFRGYLNNELSHKVGENWAIGLSSAVFGLAHDGEGDQAGALSAALAGGYLAWLHQHNNYRLAENVALHFWVNTLSNLAAIHNGGDGTTLRINFQF